MSALLLFQQGQHPLGLGCYILRGGAAQDLPALLERYEGRSTRILQDGGGSLLSQQMFYVVEEYNPMLSRGGIQYLKYNYDDVEWAAFVAEQGGILQY